MRKHMSRANVVDTMAFVSSTQERQPMWEPRAGLL
jgi:hypothetical protein